VTIIIFINLKYKYSENNIKNILLILRIRLYFSYETLNIFIIIFNYIFKFNIFLIILYKSNLIFA